MKERDTEKDNIKPTNDLSKEGDSEAKKSLIPTPSYPEDPSPTAPSRKGQVQRQGSVTKPPEEEEDERLNFKEERKRLDAIVTETPFVSAADEAGVPSAPNLHPVLKMPVVDKEEENKTPYEEELVPKSKPTPPMTRKKKLQQQKKKEKSAAVNGHEKSKVSSEQQPPKLEEVEAKESETTLEVPLEDITTASLIKNVEVEPSNRFEASSEFDVKPRKLFASLEETEKPQVSTMVTPPTPKVSRPEKTFEESRAERMRKRQALLEQEEEEEEDEKEEEETRDKFDRSPSPSVGAMRMLRRMDADDTFAKFGHLRRRRRDWEKEEDVWAKSKSAAEVPNRGATSPTPPAGISKYPGESVSYDQEARGPSAAAGLKGQDITGNGEEESWGGCPTPGTSIARDNARMCFSLKRRQFLAPAKIAIARLNAESN